MRRPVPLRRLPLVAAALAVLLGVLAMHAVSGGPHSPKGVEHPMVAELAATAEGVAGLGAHAEASVLSVSASLPGPLPGLTTPDLPAGPSASMAAMCVAMLLTLVVALGLRPLGRLHGGGTPPPPPLRDMHRDELTRAPPPDLLTRLCVLRT